MHKWVAEIKQKRDIPLYISGLLKSSKAMRGISLCIRGLLNQAKHLGAFLCT